MDVVWLKSALGDLERLYQFIKKHNPHAAKNAANKLKETVVQLKKQPYLGKPVDDLVDFRDLSIPFGSNGYVIRYRIFNEIIYIASLRHYREDNFKLN